MKTKSIKIIFILLSMYASNIVAGDLIFGLGSKTCPEYLTDRERASSFALSGTVFNRYGDWAQGYISGLPDSEQPRMEITHATIILFLDDYCRKKPLERIYSGIELLTKEAIKKSRAK